MKKIIFFALSCFLISPFANAQAPANDDCVNAEVLSCNSSATGSTVNATNPANPGNYKDIWYSITGNGGHIEITTCGSSFDTKLTVYEACGGLEITNNDDCLCCPQSAFLSKVTIWNSVVGLDYKIRVHPWAATVTGAVVINTLCSTPPLTYVPCAGITCIANPIITPNNFNYCPIDSLCLDSIATLTFWPSPCQNSVITISTCENSTVTYSTPLNIGSTYNWTVIGDVSNTPNNNEITINWGTQGMGVISVVETDAQGCVGTYTLQVEILATPTASYTVIPTPGPYCTNIGIQFNADNTNPNSGPMIYYYWDFGDGSFSNNQNYIHPGYNTPGTYNCTLVVYNECQCADTITFSVNIITGTAPEITSCINTICEGDIVEYCTNASLPSWTIEGGSIVNSLNTDPCIQVDWDNTNGTINNGYGNIYLSDLASTACQSFQAFEVPIVPLNPEINGADIVCEDEKTSYSFHCIPGVEYNWTVNGGFIVNNYPQTAYNISGVCEIEVEWPSYVSVSNKSVSLTLSSSILDCTPVFANKQVSVLEKININGNDKVCFNTNHTYSVGNNGTNELLNWSIDNGSQTTSLIGTSVDVQWDQNTGVGVVTATPVNNGVWCEPLATFVVDISENPLPPSSIDGETIVCPNGSYLYTVNPSNATSPDNLTYQWTIIGGTPATTSGNSANITWNTTDPYSIDVVNKMNDLPGCESSNTHLTINEPPYLNINISTSNQNPCVNSITSFTVTDNGNPLPPDAEIIWTVSDPTTPGTSIYGSVVSGQGTNFMEIEWGKYFNPVNQLTVAVNVTMCNTGYPQSLLVNLSDPAVSFTYNPTIACPGDPINFSASLTNPALSGNYSWNFGDGTSGSGQNTSHTYSTGGNYIASVTFTGSPGCEANSQQNIQILPSPSGDLSFNVPDINNVVSFCPPADIDFQVTLVTQGNINNIEWRDPNNNLLQDGNPNAPGNFYLYSYHVLCAGPNYSCIGNYSVTLTGANGCSEILTFEVDTGCGFCRPCETMQTSPLTCNPSTGNFSVQIFSPDYLNPDWPTLSPQWLSQQNITPLDWDFGDGTFALNTLNPTHEYSSAGFMNIESYEANHLWNCSKTIGCAEVLIPFALNWKTDNYCDITNSNQLTHTFYDNSSYYMGSGPFTVDWNFGDPLSGINNTISTTNGQIHTHIFSNTGTFIVTLTITAQTGETCSLQKSVLVNDIIASFTANPNPSCEDIPTVAFSSNAPNNIISSWDWDFGDGSGSNLSNPERTYTISGNYTANLSLLFENGCIATSSLAIIVNSTPQLSTTIPPTFYSHCTGSGQYALNGIAYSLSGDVISWVGPGIVQNGINWFFDPDLAGEGTHEICARATNPNTGCYDEECFDISVFCAEQPKIFGESQFCQDFDDELNLSTQSGFSDYEWEKNNTIIFGATSSTYNDYSFSGYAVGTYTYEVTFTDNNGCTSTSDPFNVVRNPLPNPFSITTNSPICAGSQVTLSHNGTQSNVDYVWNTIPAQTTQSVTILPEYNLIYVVAAINEYGCIISSNAIEVAEEILVCNILSGCYCDTTLLNVNGDIEIPGLSNSSLYSTYEWILTLPTLPNSTIIILSTNQDLVIGSSHPNYQDIFDGYITLSVVDVYGCSAVSEPLSIEQCSSCSLTLSSYQGDCVYDDATGIITGDLSIGVTGGSGNYMFDWGFVYGMTITPINYMTGLVDGIYCVTVTDVNNLTCIATICDTVECSCCCFGVTISDTCRGINNTTSVDDIYVTVNGGTAPYNYIWSTTIGSNPVILSNTVSSLSTTELIGVSDGTYCLYVMDADSCIMDTCIVVNCHCCLVITDVVDTCLAGGGDLEVTVFGGNSNYTYTYSWTSNALSPIPSSNHISNLPNGVYNLHVEEDSSHCFLDTTFVVNCPCNLILSATDTCLIDNCNNWIWDYDFTNTFPDEYNGESYSVLNTAEIAWGNFGSQTKTVSLDSLCDHDTVTISFDLYIIDSWDGNANPTVGPDIFSFNIDGSVLLNTTFSNNPSTNQSFPGNIGSSFPGQTGSVLTYGTFTNGYSLYQFSYTIAHNSSLLLLEFIGDPAENISNESWALDNILIQLHNTSGSSYGGSIDLTVSGGTQPYTYSWDNLSLSTTEDISGLPNGTYCVTVTDASIPHCTENLCVTINCDTCDNNLCLTAIDSCSTANCSLCGDLNGDGIINVMDIMALNQIILSGIYSSSADLNCDGVVNMLDNTLLQNHIMTGTPLNCCSSTLCGFIDLTVSCGIGPYTYDWSNGETTEDIYNLSVGTTYCVVVTDANGCTDTLCVTINCDTCISIADPGFENSVNNSTLVDWSISHGTPTNGPPGYMGNGHLYLWSGSTTFTPTGEGVYTCFNFNTTKCYDISFYAYVEDNTINATFELAQTSNLTPNGLYAIPTVPSSTIHSVPFSSMGPNWAQITISGYQPPQNDDQFWIYPLYVNLPGAAKIWIDEIHITEVPCSNYCNLTLSATDTCLPGAVVGSYYGDINLTVSGGIAPYTYLWNNGLTTEDISGLPNGTYCVTVTDDSNPPCVENLCVTIDCDPCDIILSTNDCSPGACNGSVTVPAGEIPTGYSFELSNGGSPYYLTNPSAGGTINNLCAGWYQYCIIDLDGTVICCDSIEILYSLLACGEVTGVYVDDIIHDRATFNWDDMNQGNCVVDQIRIRYRDVFTSAYSTKTMGSPVGNSALCLNTSKLVLNLSPSTTYEYDFKIWYQDGTVVTWHAYGTFTTLCECPNVVNFSVSSPSNSQALFTWAPPLVAAPCPQYSFVRIKLREDIQGNTTWINSGGMGVPFLTFLKIKNGLTPGMPYRAQSRTWCSPTGGPYKASTWTPLIFWGQPLRLAGETIIDDLNIYPNPSRDIFNISFVSADIQNIDIKVVNLIGETLWNESLGKFVGEYTKKINLEGYLKAVYFLEIQTDNGIVNKKLILQ